jgi:drug/metabolite transporter (DMT)-like permease
MSIEDIAFTLKTVSSSRTAAVIGIVAAIGGPLAIIAFGGVEASNLPWSVWATLLLALLLVIWRGYYLFTVNHDAKDISISPDRRG